MLRLRHFPVATKFLDKKGGSIKIFQRKFFVSQCRKISKQTPSVFQKNSCVENFHALDGKHHNFVENFLSHRTEKIRKGSLLCFTKNQVSKKFMDKRGGGSIRIFCQNFFRLRMSKKFAGEPFSVSLTSGIEKR